MWLTVFFCGILLAALMLLGLWALGPDGKKLRPEQRALHLAELAVKLAQGRQTSGRFTIDWENGLCMLELRDGSLWTAENGGSHLGLTLLERQFLWEYGELRQSTFRVVIQTDMEPPAQRQIRALMERHRTAFGRMVSGQRLLETEFG